MFDLNDGPVIRINQAGYAEGLPVYAAILTKGNDGSFTYAAPVAIPGAVSLSLDAEGESSPFYGIADKLICAKSDMVSFLDSLVAPMSLINALIVSVGVKSKENLSVTFKRLETIWADYDVYERTDS